jgi:hypothetical protein
MQNQLFRIKFTPNATQACVWNPANTLQNVLNTIKLRFDFRFQKVWPRSHGKEKGKIINCHYPDISWNSRCLLLWISHTNFHPLFNRFSTFDKNVDLSKINLETEKSFLVFPSLNTSIFYDVSKNSEHINTSRGALLRKSPSPNSEVLTF